MDGFQYIRFTFPGLEKVRCFFGTRLGGISSGVYAESNISLEVGDEHGNAAANREALKRELGLKAWTELKQVHGDSVSFDPPENFLKGAGEEGDGIAISRPGEGALIKTADCQPIFVAHESERYVLALHCGWRGNRAKFPETGIRNFCSHFGLLPSELMAVRGPSLGPCCARFHSFDEHWTAEFAEYYNAEAGKMDLWSLTLDQLIHAGLHPENIFSLDLCTRCRDDLFFSYRRENLCGRQGSIVFFEE